MLNGVVHFCLRVQTILEISLTPAQRSPIMDT
jgi:hypothetical protein